MFEIEIKKNGEVAVSGRLDAAQAARAQEFLDGAGDRCVLDMTGLEYISSAGLGVLVRTHKRLMTADSGLELVNVSKHIADIFRYSGFDKLFVIRVT